MVSVEIIKFLSNSISGKPRILLIHTDNTHVLYTHNLTPDERDTLKNIQPGTYGALIQLNGDIYTLYTHIYTFNVYMTSLYPRIMAIKPTGRVQ